MMVDQSSFNAIRSSIATIPADVSNDAVGNQTAKLEDIYAPATHASALDPTTPIIVGSRGTGKSFWSSVLGQEETRAAATKAYPRLGLERVIVHFGFTGVVGGPSGVSADALNQYVKDDATKREALGFWWATVLRAAALASGEIPAPRFGELLPIASDWEKREEALTKHDQHLTTRGKVLLVVYDALDAVAVTWPRRRLLTEALFEVVWAMRAYRSIRLKLFLRPDQIDDDALQFVELPKLRTGAVRLTWTGTDLFGLLFSRLALAKDQEAKESFGILLESLGLSITDGDSILQRRWPLSHEAENQSRVMSALAGPYMASGTYGYKKGKTYDWPVKHLADAFDEVTPRSFLGLAIAAAKYGPAPLDRAITPDGIRHGLREASKTRVDQLHQEFPWIKGVLAPLDGLLLPQDEAEVFAVWSRAKTVDHVRTDANQEKYLPPFATVASSREPERDLFAAMERIGVMFRRKDGRIDMPDLFRVAAKLLKKGGTAPR